MARIKTEQEVAQEKAVKTAEAAAAQEAVQEKEAEAVSGESAEPEVEKTETAAQEETPVWIDKILRSFKNLDELYITKTGGVLTKGTPAHLLKSAVLYKNPYYKK